MGFCFSLLAIHIHMFSFLVCLTRAYVHTQSLVCPDSFPDNLSSPFFPFGFGIVLPILGICPQVSHQSCLLWCTWPASPSAGKAPPQSPFWELSGWWYPCRERQKPNLLGRRSHESRLRWINASPILFKNFLYFTNRRRISGKRKKKLLHVTTTRSGSITH